MNGTSTVVDVRIIVEGIRDVKKICEALEHSSLGSDYSASVTSIIPTTNPKLAQSAVHGADIVIVATDADSEGKNLGKRMEEALSYGSGIIDKIRLPSGQDIEFSDAILIRDAIEKAIVRAGLQALRMLSCADMEEDSFEAVADVNEIQESLPEESQDDEELVYEFNQLQIDNKKYESQIDTLEKRVNELLVDSYNRYDIREVWESLYDAPAPASEDVALAAIRLSDEVFASGSFLFAQSLKEVEDFLKEFQDTIQE